MIFFASNIKFLRELDKVSHEGFCKASGIKLRVLKNIESKRTKRYCPNLLERFSDHFNLTIDDLIKRDLASMGNEKIINMKIEYLSKYFTPKIKATA